MPVLEIRNNKSKRRAITEYRRIFPQIENYADVMAAMSDDEWSRYQIFTAEDATKVHGLADLSPEGNFSIYAAETSVQLELLQTLLSLTNQTPPRLILGPFTLQRVIDSIPALANYKAHPFLHMQSDREFPAESAAHAQLQFIRAMPTPEHHTMVDEWYRYYNEEQGTNWTTPALQEIATKALYFLIDDQKNLKAACANTLRSSDRFWIGRLWIPKSARGRGLGKTMMLRLGAKAREEGKPISLHVFTNNAPAIALYKSLAFRTIGENAYWSTFSS